MSSHEDRLRQAKKSAVTQRARMRQRASATKHRLAPGALAADVRQAAEHGVSNAASTAATAVKSHPYVAGAAAVGVLAWLFREPIIEHVLPAIGDAIEDAWAAAADAAASARDENDSGKDSDA